MNNRPLQFRAIYCQGDKRYLLVRQDEDKPTGNAWILDTTNATLYPPMPRGAILSQGYWEPCALGADDLEPMLAKVTTDLSTINARRPR